MTNQLTWEKDYYKAFPKVIPVENGSFVIMRSDEEDKKLKSFIRSLLSSRLKSLRERIEGMKKMQTKHFSKGIEVIHHGTHPCTEDCILNGKEMNIPFNQALDKVISVLDLLKKEEI